MRIEVERVDRYITGPDRDIPNVFISVEPDYVVVNETFEFPIYAVPDAVERFMKSPRVRKEEAGFSIWEEYIYEYDEDVVCTQVHIIYKKKGEKVR